MSINRRDFLMGGIKGTAAYTLLASTILGSNNAMAKGPKQGSSDPSEDEPADRSAAEDKEAPG